jgi:hypothetical protein
MTDRPERLSDQSDEDLSLQPLLQALWSYRRVMLVAFVAIVLGYLALMMTAYARQPHERIASIAVRLTFEGAAEDHFPNGTKFSSTEIVSTPVLTEVFRKNDLQRFGTFEFFKDSMFVLQSNPDLELLSFEYQTKLSDARIGPVERARLEEEFRKKRESLKSPIVSVNLRRTERMSRMPDVLMSKILGDTLSTWAEQAAQRKGIARYDTPVLSRNVLRKDLLSTEDYVIAADVLRSTIERILTTVADVEKIPGSGAIRVGEQQVGLADIRAHLEDLVRFRVQPLISDIRYSGVSRNASRIDLYFEGRLYETQAALDGAEQRLRTVQDALRAYQQRGIDAGLTPGDSGRSASVTPQLSESFIDKLVDLSRQSNDVQYRQDMTNRVIEDGIAAADLKKQVAYYESMRKAFAGTRPASNPKAEVEVTARMNSIFEDIGSSVDQMQALYKIVAEQNLNPNTVLYTVTSPFFVKTTSALTLRTVLLYLIMILLISLIAVPALCLLHRYFHHWSPSRPPAGGPPAGAPRVAGV